MAKDKKKSSFMEDMLKLKARSEGAGAVDTISKIVESNNGDVEKVKENTENAVKRNSEAIKSYDEDTENAKSDNDIKKAQVKATVLSDSADKDYDNFSTWDSYYSALKKSGLTDEQIKTKLKGSKWDKEGSQYSKWASDFKNEIEKKEPSSIKKEDTEIQKESLTEEQKDDTQELPPDEVSQIVSPIQENVEKSKAIMDNKQKLSEYLNSAYPTTAGLIFGDSGLSLGQRLAVGLSALGKIAGSTVLANGSSLLGDNAQWSKIAEGLGVENFTNENQKKYATEMNNAIIETAKQTTQNKGLLSKLYDAQGQSISEKQLDYLSYFTTVIGSMSEGDAVNELKRNGFDDDQARTAYENCRQASQTTTSAQTLTQGATTTESTKLNLFNQKFDTEKKRNDAINELQKRRDELQSRLAEISKMDFNEIIEFAKANRELMQGVASFSSNASSNRSEGESSSSNWGVNGSITIPSIGSIGGNHTSASSSILSTSTAEGFAKTMDQLALSGINAGSAKAQKWWKENGKTLQAGMKAGIESAIRDIDTQIEQYKNMSIGMSDERLKTIESLDFENEEEKEIWRWLTGLDSFEVGERDFNKIYQSLL